MDDARIAFEIIEKAEKGQQIEPKEMAAVLRMARERIQECEGRIVEMGGLLRESNRRNLSHEHALTMIKTLAFYTEDREALKEVFEFLRKILVI